MKINVCPLKGWLAVRLAFLFLLLLLIVRNYFFGVLLKGYRRKRIFIIIILLYHRLLLSKISWNLTIADISKTWIIENLDSIVSKYIRQWLELPISATLSSLIIKRSKYGISLVLPSIKFIQCQTNTRNKLKSSPNNDIVHLWEETSHHTNIQYDQYRNSKQALKAIQTKHEDRINHELLSQGFVISSILKYSLSSTTAIWSKVQQRLPKNIFNFTVKYLNNTLATRKNLHKWSLSESPSCSFCLQSETLQHIVSSCKHYLDHGRYNWRHDSVLLCLAKSLSHLTDWSSTQTYLHFHLHA